MQVRRPVGVAILAILYVVVGGWAAVQGVGMLIVQPASDEEVYIEDSVMVMFTLAIAIPCLFLGWGLWRLRLWAWWLQVVLVLLPFILLLAGLIFAGGSSPSYLLETLTLLAPGAVILAYFMTEPIRSAFGVSGTYPAGTVTR